MVLNKKKILFESSVDLHPFVFSLLSLNQEKSLRYDLRLLMFIHKNKISVKITKFIVIRERYLCICN
mgnify:CR=1 FL=1